MEIILLNKNNSYGKIFQIKKQLKFGSDHPSNIRIKSSSLSSEHALIEIDQNGKCYLLHISSHNPPKVNGIKCGKEPFYLNSGDIISMGGRSFLFQSTNESEKILNDSNISESEISQATNESESTRLIECGYLYICNRDGTERSPFHIKCDVVFGCEPPASIRIKSSSIQPIHAKISVQDFDYKFHYKLIPLTPINPPRVNNQSIPYVQDSEENSGVYLSNNDEILIGGRIFKFRIVSSKREDDMMSVSSFSENEESPGRNSFTSDDERDSLINEKIRERKNKNYNNSNNEVNNSRLTINTTESTTHLSSTNVITSTIDDSPTLKPPPRPPTPPAIKFKTLALMGATLATSKSNGQFSSLTQSSLEKRELRNKNDRLTPPLPVSSSIRSSNLLFNRNESIDVSGSDCEGFESITHKKSHFNEINNSNEGTNQIISNHDNNNNDNNSTKNESNEVNLKLPQISNTPPRVNKPTSSHFISPPSPSPFPISISLEERSNMNNNTDRYDSLLHSPRSYSPNSEKVDEQKVDVEPKLSLLSSSSPSILTNEESIDNIKIENNSSSLPLTVNQIPAFSILRQDTLLYDDSESIYSPTLSNTSSFPPSPFLQPNHINSTIQNQEESKTFEAASHIFPNPITSTIETNNSESKSVESPLQSITTFTPPPLPQRQNVINLNRTNSNSTITETQTEIANTITITNNNNQNNNQNNENNRNNIENTIHSINPPIRPSLINNLFSPISKVAALLIKPLISFVYPLQPQRLITNRPIVSPDTDLEENISENMTSDSISETSNNNDIQNDNLPDSVIRYEGLKILLNYNFYVLKHMYGTFKGLFFR